MWVFYKENLKIPTGAYRSTTSSFLLDNFDWTVLSRQKELRAHFWTADDSEDLFCVLKLCSLFQYVLLSRIVENHSMQDFPAISRFVKAFGYSWDATTKLWKLQLEWFGGAETPAIASTIEYNNWLEYQVGRKHSGSTYNGDPVGILIFFL